MTSEGRTAADGADIAPVDLDDTSLINSLTPLARQGAQRIELSLLDDAIEVRAQFHGPLAHCFDLACKGRPFPPSLTAQAVLATAHGRFSIEVGNARIVLDRIDRREAIDAVALPGISAPVLALMNEMLGMRSGLVIAAGPANSGKRAILSAIGDAVDPLARSVLVVAADPVAPKPYRRCLQVDPSDPAARLQALKQAESSRPDLLILDRIDVPDVARAALKHAQQRLVFATVDCADAVGAIAALRSLRVDRFDLAASLRAIVARRPVDRLCPRCARPVQASGSVSALLGFDRGAVVHVADGCPECDGTGTGGAIGVFEGISVDRDLARLVNSGGDSSILARHAFLNAPNLGSAARAMVRAGIIAADEAVRLSRSGTADAAGTGPAGLSSGQHASILDGPAIGPLIAPIPRRS